MSLVRLLGQLRTADAMAAQMERDAEKGLRAARQAARLGARMRSAQPFAFHATCLEHQRNAARLRAETARARASLLVTLCVLCWRIPGPPRADR